MGLATIRVWQKEHQEAALSPAWEEPTLDLLLNRRMAALGVWEQVARDCLSSTAQDHQEATQITPPQAHSLIN
ncbi:hypothetical protein NDU88_005288 [Pleurodeles waltl]|uniref:Uncharacterized protein n=1 Tax=Pleurodeles waltl TaxID=8319 RepID=A0AAV7TTL4_PLEWA|nr:hypothetical protein NDU88_005288 [Pleurodeles waltl]